MLPRRKSNHNTLGNNLVDHNRPLYSQEILIDQSTENDNMPASMYRGFGEGMMVEGASGTTASTFLNLV